MRTIEEHASSSRIQTFRNNLRLARRIALMVFGYFTRGRRVRRAYRQCEARGEVFWVDDPASWRD